jgi:hypothetical protein
LLSFIFRGGKRKGNEEKGEEEIRKLHVILILYIDKTKYIINTFGIADSFYCRNTSCNNWTMTI